jgi:hypothetical protein
MIEVKYDGTYVEIDRICSFDLLVNLKGANVEKFCNCCYDQDLNKEDMRKLIDALQALYEKMT